MIFTYRIVVIMTFLKNNNNTYSKHTHTISPPRIRPYTLQISPSFSRKPKKVEKDFFFIFSKKKISHTMEKDFKNEFLSRIHSLRLVESSNDYSILWLYVFDTSTTPFFAIPTRASILSRTCPSDSTERLILNQLSENGFFFMDRIIDADEKVKVFEDFGLMERGSTHDILNDVSSSNVPLSMYVS